MDDDRRRRTLGEPKPNDHLVEDASLREVVQILARDVRRVLERQAPASEQPASDDR